MLEDQRRRAEATERRSADTAAETRESADIVPDVEEDDSFDDASPPYEADARADTQDTRADTQKPLHPKGRRTVMRGTTTAPAQSQPMIRLVSTTTTRRLATEFVSGGASPAVTGLRTSRGFAGADNSDRRTNAKGRGGRAHRPSDVGTERSKTDGSEWWYAVVSSRKPGRDMSDIDTERAAGRRSAIDRAGMSAVERHERTAGRHPEAQPANNPGFDIDSCNLAGETLRLIEVKSLTGGCGAGGLPKLTPTQWEMALKERERYWLTSSSTPRATRRSSPGSKIQPVRLHATSLTRAGALSENERVRSQARATRRPRPRRRGSPRTRPARHSRL